MHPLTPVVKSWQVLAFVLFMIFQQFGQNVVPGAGDTGDRANLADRPSGRFLAGGTLVLLSVVVVGVVFIVVSWRMARFRVSADALELHHGVLYRQQRRARLDRLQAVDVVQPLLARVVGLAKITLEVAGGGDSRIELAFLTEAEAQRLRNTLLARAAGVRYDDAAEAPAAPERPVLEVSVGRLVAALALSGASVFGVVAAVGLLVGTVVTGEFGLMGALLPTALAAGSYLWARFTREFGFRVATSPDGLRLRHGLLEHRAQTLPPGRVQAVRVDQPLLWRSQDWWRVRANVAGYVGGTDGGQVTENTLLPVGTRGEAMVVLALIMTDLGELDGQRPEDVVSAGMSGSAGQGGFVTSPRRAAWLDPLVWRRTGFRVTGRVLLLRRGFLTRTLDLVPHARAQSCALSQGPLQRRLGLVTFGLHSTQGPVTPALPQMDEGVAARLLAEETLRARQARAAAGPERWMEAGGTSPA